MPAATRVGDANTGHDLCPPTALSSGSPNVFINGKPAGRVGDSYAPHSGTIASGAPHVFINGKPAGRVGDSVSCGGSVAQGSSDVFIGDEGSNLSCSTSVLDFKLECVSEVISASPLFNEIDEIILAVPKIAQNKASTYQDKNDQQGWLYLSDMAKKWIVGQSEILTTTSPIIRQDQIFDISWNWGYSYSKIKDAVNKFLSDSEPNTKYRIFNKAAQDSLIKILRSEKLLYPGATFDFINTEKTAFKNNYFAHYTIDREYLSDDGLTSCLAGCSIRALAKGYVTESDDGLDVIVEEIGLFIFDVFQFEEDESFSLFYDNLGFWSKKQLDFSFFPGTTYYNLTNSDFNSFRKRFSRGQDFFVISDVFKDPSFSKKKIHIN